MKVLVTGANGFVGAAVCKKLLDRGDYVRGLVRKTSDLSLLKGLNVDLEVVSLNDKEALASVVKDIDVVYHVAAAVGDWGSLEWFREINVYATRRLMELSAAAGVKRLVYVSSVAVHSFIDAQDMDETAPQNPTPFPYCQSKREAEEVVRAFHQKGGMETVIIRPGDVYGPGDRTSLLKMAPMLEKGLLLLIDNGRTLGAFTYVENLADGILLGGLHPAAAGDTFIITDGIKMSWKEYFDRLCSALDLPHPRLSLKPGFVRALARCMESLHRSLRLKQRPFITCYLAEHLCSDFHFSVEKAATVLGYSPAVTVDEAITATSRWYREAVRGEKK
ncbi:NAD-dependent epimerase/dehydratase family protein [bacterium]|nr:NAD-dependent epimerase/dehydratase family protein [bacterium]